MLPVHVQGAGLDQGMGLVRVQGVGLVHVQGGVHVHVQAGVSYIYRAGVSLMYRAEKGRFGVLGSALCRETLCTSGRETSGEDTLERFYLNFQSRLRVQF